MDNRGLSPRWRIVTLSNFLEATDFNGLFRAFPGVIVSRNNYQQDARAHLQSLERYGATETFRTKEIRGGAGTNR
jgi:hypothetical protein